MAAILYPDPRASFHPSPVRRAPIQFRGYPLWDRLFGTYKDTTEFADRCGFPKGAEEKFGDMLVFKDVYYEDTA